MEAVARDLLGEPNEPPSSDDELRFGSRGSLAVNLEAGTFFGHEAGAGGGVIDLVMNRRHVDKEGALRWLREHEHLPEPGKFNIVAGVPYSDVIKGVQWVEGIGLGRLKTATGRCYSD